MTLMERIEQARRERAAQEPAKPEQQVCSCGCGLTVQPAEVAGL